MPIHVPDHATARLEADNEHGCSIGHELYLDTRGLILELSKLSAVRHVVERTLQQGCR